MDVTLNCALASALARELRAGREELTRRWLQRIAARVNISPNEIFPTDELLDHVPVLVDGIADYLENSADEISADVPVLHKAIELGELRHRQGFSAHQILKEYEILGGVLFHFLILTVEEIDEPCTRGDLLACAHRVFRAIAVIQQVTTAHYLSLAEERVREREERLRGFNRTVSHELKNRLGAVSGAVQMLQDESVRIQPEMQERFVTMVRTNALAMQGVLEDLLALSRTDTDQRRQRHVLLPEAVAEVVRQLRGLAAERRVLVRIQGSLPREEVNAAAVELSLSNLVANSIKYADPTRELSWVEIEAGIAASELGRELVVRVGDNGIGVAPEERERLFERFFRSRAATERNIEGTGLGLSIVRDTISNLGGRVWAEFPEGGGSVFCFGLPLRRSGDGYPDAAPGPGTEPAL
jgi:signal transduction histidine kinase